MDARTRHLAGGLSLRRVSPEASAAWRATYWGCEAPQPVRKYDRVHEYRRLVVLSLAFYRSLIVYRQESSEAHFA